MKKQGNCVFYRIMATLFCFTLILSPLGIILFAMADQIELADK